MSIFSKISRGFKSIVPKQVRDIGKVAVGFIPGVGPALAAGIKAIDTAGRIKQQLTRAVGGAVASQHQTGGFIDITQRPMNMSILGGLGMLPQLGRAAGAVVPAAGRAVVGAGRAAGGLVRRFLNTPGGKWTRKAIRDAGLIATGGLVFDAAGNLLGTVSRRRMNPLNARALRRSIRRVKSARGICQDIERMLPKKKSAAACAPKRKRC